MATLSPLKVAILIILSLSCFVAPSLQQKSNLTLSVDTPRTYPKNHKKINATYKVKVGSVGLTALNIVAIQMAVDYVNNNDTLLPDVSLEFFQTTSPDSTILFQTLYQLQELGVNVLLGPTTSSQTIVMQGVAKIYNVPQVGSVALSNSLTDKTLYPTFLRTLASDYAQINAIISFFQECGWKKAVLMYSTNDYGLGYSELVLRGSRLGISFTVLSASVAGSTPEYFAPVAETAKQLNEQHRIFVLYTSSITPHLMQALNNSGLSKPGNVFIIAGDVANAARQLGIYRVLDGMFGIGSGLPGGPDYDTIMEYWRNWNGTQYSGIALGSFYAIDAVLSVAYGYDRLLKANVPFSSITGPVLLNSLLNNSYPGVTGSPVQIDATGNRIGTFMIYNYVVTEDAEYKTVATYSAATQTYTRVADYQFNGFAPGVIPPDGPYTCAACVHGTCVENQGCVCLKGYSGIACDVKDKSDTVILPWLIPLIALIIIGAIGGFVFYKKKRSMLVRQVAEKQKSIITRQDLSLSYRIGRGASGEVWKGVYRGTDVAIKKIMTAQVDKQVLEEFELEVAIMCGLRHPNIILFMGSCYDPVAGEMLLVMEFMARGSLNDVIHNQNIPLPFEMKVHLALQAAQGMNFLHQSTPPTIHLDLKSHNILLDEKWNARISDFGISKFKEDSKKTRANGGGQSIGTIYWSAPEALEGKEVSEKSDCFSFGIVLWELFHRQMPYKGRDPISVAVDVIQSGMRPPIDANLPEDVKNLITACWAQDPNERISFQEIMNHLRNLSFVNPLQDHGGALRTVDAPTGNVFLVATDVVGWQSLWDSVPRDMETAMKLHNQIVRNNIDIYKGYEVSFVNHSFLVAFSALDDAINFTVALQISLLHVEWPALLLEQPICVPVRNDDNNAIIWKGLRVKVAACGGVPNCAVDAATGRMTYFGAVVEKLNRILGLMKDGGVVLDNITCDFLTKKNPSLIQEVTTERVGEIKGASARSKEGIHQLNILSLVRAKATPSLESEPSLPHMVVTVEEFNDGVDVMTSDGSSSALVMNQIKDKNVDWLATNSEIETKDVIGKGPIGDYYRGTWKGKEVALKILVNQKLKEDDLFKLMGDSSYMRKLNHPNLLPLYAVCMEPNHLTIVSEYMPKGNLRTLLNNQSVQLPMDKKIKIALGLAQGMFYLTGLPDVYMQLHDNLKSNNVLLTKDLEVKVADYGHSNIRELARTMTSVGNIAWTAPELLSGEPATVRCALYSFGIILYELYTRQVPYASEHPIRVVSKILSGYRPTLPADCPQAYKQIVEQCLNADPHERPEWQNIIDTLSSM